MDGMREVIDFIQENQNVEQKSVVDDLDINFEI